VPLRDRVGRFWAAALPSAGGPSRDCLARAEHTAIAQ
jgi:hypothetical protein